MSLKTLLQYCIPKRTLSALAGKLAHCQKRWWKNWAIAHFIKKYGVDLTAAVLQNIDEYPDFNSFFTRHLKPELRPIAEDPDAIVSPVDGSISQIGKIRNDLLIQAKGFYFNVNALLGGGEQARLFYDGSFATLYLSPKDYHRVHMPIAGRLQETIYVPGTLFSVSQETTLQIPQLFVQNERLICLFETALGPMAVIFVGAIIVSGIHTVWPLEKHSKKITKKYYTELIQLERGAELGHFSVGSTVILLFPKNTMVWEPHLQIAQAVQMGQIIAKCQRFTE